jgi:hypothetical protein
MKNKKANKTIKNWQIHTLSFTQEDINKVYPGENLQPLIVTGTVVEDKSGKFKPGYHMRSSLIKKIDREKKEIETKNTVYKLEGKEGTDIFPNLEDAVLNIFY